MNLKLFSVCIAFALSACSHTPKPVANTSQTGAGNIKFSVSSMATYQSYFQKNHPLDFAITTDGERGFFSYCPVNGKDKCRENTSTLLLNECENRSEKSCKLFAKRGRVVWDQPGSWTNKEKVGTHFFVDHKGIPSHELQ